MVSSWRVFTIPGLGFTPEVFQRIELPWPVEHLSWLEPEDGEGLAEYAVRMSTPMRGDGAPIAIVGHSFGGVMGMEIAARIPVACVILVSSVKSRREMPVWLRAAAPLGLHRTFFKQLTLATLPMWGRFFGYASGEEQDVFRRMVSMQSNRTLQWSLRELSRWRGSDPGGAAVHHLHGDRDRTLPFSRIEEPVIRIASGTHFMVRRQAAEVSLKIRGWLEDSP